MRRRPPGSTDAAPHYHPHRLVDERSAAAIAASAIETDDVVKEAVVMTAVQNGRDRKTPEGGRPSRDKDPGPRHSRLAVPRTRMGELWVAVVLFAFVLLLLLIFVLQNGQRADVSFLGAHGQLPVGVALLLAAVFGVLLVALPGTARVVQLRMLARRSGRARGEPLTGPIQRAPDDHNPAEH